jgi:phosphoglycolate phosphatase
LLGDRQEAAAALRYYRERFADTGLYENRIYPGIEDALAALGASGHRLFIATSKPAIYAQRIVAHFGIEGHFERLFGSELDGTRSDKTELLNHALDETGIDPGATVMIGDRSHDMIGARNNDMTAVGVLYGYGSKDELIAAGAQHIARTPEELPDIANPQGSSPIAETADPNEELSNP